MMTSFCYYDQNPSAFCFLVQISAFVIITILAGISKFKYEGKNVKDSGHSSRMMHCANALFTCIGLLSSEVAISWIEGDAEDLPIATSSFDAYTIAFGIRNVTRIHKVNLWILCVGLLAGFLFGAASKK